MVSKSTDIYVHEFLIPHCEDVLVLPWHSFEHFINAYDRVCVDWDVFKKPYSLTSEADKDYFDCIFMIYQEFETYVQEAPTKSFFSRKVDNVRFKTSMGYYVCYACRYLLEYYIKSSVLSKFIDELYDARKLDEELVMSLISERFSQYKIEKT